jgi:hypothetical protein
MTDGFRIQLLHASTTVAAIARRLPGTIRLGLWPSMANSGSKIRRGLVKMKYYLSKKMDNKTSECGCINCDSLALSCRDVNDIKGYYKKHYELTIKERNAAKKKMIFPSLILFLLLKKKLSNATLKNGKIIKIFLQRSLRIYLKVSKNALNFATIRPS